MAVYNYDVVILGSGPAGEGGAAMNAAKAGRKVATVENRGVLGGGSTHLAPSLKSAASLSASDFAF